MRLWKKANNELEEVKKEKGLLATALEDAQEKNAVLGNSCKALVSQVKMLEKVAQPFSVYPPIEVPAVIPITLYFVDAVSEEDDDDDELTLVHNVLESFLDHEDKFCVVGYSLNLEDTASMNRYVIIQPAIPSPPSSWLAISREIGSRLSQMRTEAIAAGAVNAVFAEKESNVAEEEQQVPSYRVRFTVASPDRRYQTRGNIMYVYSLLCDLKENISKEEIAMIRAEYPEYEVIFSGWRD